MSELAETYPSLRGQAHKTIWNSHKLIVLRLAVSETALRHLKFVWVGFRFLQQTLLLQTRLRHPRSYAVALLHGTDQERDRHPKAMATNTTM